MSAEETGNGFGAAGRGVGPQSVVDQVVDAVLRLILSGELGPGTPVAIQTLSQRLQVSSVPVREALRTLEGRGLIEFQRGRRPRVSPVRLDDFEDVFSLRATLEGAAAKRGTPGPELVGQLKSALASMDNFMQQGDPLASYTSHAEFHTLMLPAATPWEMRFLDELWIASERYIHLFLTSVDSQQSASMVHDVHATLIDAVATGTPATIRKAITSHVKDSHQLLESAVHQASAKQV